MKNSDNSDFTKTLKRHYSFLSLDPRISGNLLLTIGRWVRGGGTTQAVMRLKQVKLCLIHQWAGDRDYLSHAPWFKRSKDGKGLSGPFHSFFITQNLTSHKRRRILSIINSYMVFFNDESQRRKGEKEAIKFIQMPYKGDESLLNKDHLPLKFTMGMRIPYINDEVEPSIVGLSTSKPKGHEVSDSKFLNSLMYTAYHWLPYQNTLDASSIKPVGEIADFPDDLSAGRIQFLHEKGLKTRVICLPHSEYQVVFSKMHKVMNVCLSTLHEDCTFDQEKGALWASDKLKQGCTLNSIDLKSATDRFPRKLQLDFAVKAGLPREWARAFEATVSLPHSYGNGKTLQYEVGQPMGYYGSFPLLAMGQHGLIRLAAYNIKRTYKDQYVVLGDDVIISDPLLSDEYYRLLNFYDIPISHQKCLCSDKAAEFAGFFITKNSIDKGAKPSSKDVSGTMVLNYAKTLGKMPKTHYLNSSLSSVLYPLVYGLVEHGALGFNPSGLSKKDRSFWFDDVLGTDLDQNQENVLTWTRVRAHVNELMYNNSGAIPGIGYILGNYVDKIESILKNKVDESPLSFLGSSDYVYDHLASIDPSFLLGVTPFSKEDTPVSNKWVRKKFPYYFMLQQELNET